MKLPAGPRILIAVSCLLAALLATLAVVQYRWAGSLAVADAERTREQMRTAASLLARDFDLRLADAYTAIQNQIASPDVPGPFHLPPSLQGAIEAVYLVKGEGRTMESSQLGADGQWKSVSNETVEKLGLHSSGPDLRADIPAMIIPAPVSIPSIRSADARAVMEQLRAANRCVFVKLNLAYLRETLLPSLVEKYFGKGASRNYELVVVNRETKKTIYPRAGEDLTAKGPAPEVRQELFSLRTDDLIQRALSPLPKGKQGMHVVVRSMQVGPVHSLASRRKTDEGGAWELDVRDRTGLLASTSLARWRQGTLVTSLAVELMLGLSIAFLVLAMRRMELASRQKMQFVAGVSHELRTPVSAISMLSRNQADGLVRTPEQVKQYGALIHQQTGRLSEMVEQTLQFAGIHSERRKPMLRTVDPAEIVRCALAARQTELGEGGFDVQSEIAAGVPPVLADPQWLEEAVGNLISNAIKYSRSRRWIRVAAQPDPDGKNVAITVEDRGIGIDDSDRDRLFQPFFRGQRALSEQIPGNGLGLSLVRSAAEAHRGSVSFSSEPDRGSSFTIRLPIAQDA